MSSSPGAIARRLAFVYVAAALALYALLNVCFTGALVCAAAVYALPLSPVLRALEWPWGDIVPPTMFSGPWLGKAFVLAAIVINALIVYAIARAPGWIAAGGLASSVTRLRRAIRARRAPSAALPRMRERIAAAWRRDPPRMVGAIVALAYAVPSLFVYVDALGCIGVLCDLGAIVVALPWSAVVSPPRNAAGGVMLLAMVALNGVLLYLVASALVRAAIAMRRRRGG